MKVVGVLEKKYISKETQKEVHGYEIYGTYPSKRCMYGEKVATEYLSAYIVEKNGGVLPQVGEELEVTFNRNGNVVGYTIK